jgi:hypothetical protein
MATHDALTTLEPISLRDRDWSVYRCALGCVHVVLDRLTLTFSDEEYHLFQGLIQRAGQRLGVIQSASAGTRAH